jgi:serine/threonine protein kinase
MGEVWKARDTRLDRIVAIKVSDQRFTERFAREAQAIAALNHPHICQLYDVGPDYLVMEYVDGKPLSGPLPLTHVLEFGAQICDALDAAHKKGIVHRDLKPANILVATSGIKLLDFGLAKWVDRHPADGLTKSISITQEHAIIGTLQYMSPEQLDGRDADTRSDIFAVGAVLYEMVTGKRAFNGANRNSLIASILERDPAPLSTPGSAVPRSLERVVAKCLAKDPDLRWQSAQDLKDELRWIGEGGALAPVVAPVRSPWRERIAWFAVAALLGGLVLFANFHRPSSSDPEPVRFAIYPPGKTIFSPPFYTTLGTPQFALSPDGRALAFVAGSAGVKPMLWLRPLNTLEARELPGTESAQGPFWSPDSRWIGFASEHRFKKVPAAGGPVQVIAEARSETRGSSWGADGTILFSSGNRSIDRVSDSGGAVTPVTKRDLSHNEGPSRFPYFLPDGQHFVFTLRNLAAEQRGIYVGSLDGKVKKPLLALDSSAAYAPPGYLLFVSENKLFGQPFDAQRLELSGQPFLIAEGVGHASSSYGAFSVSQTGALAYAGSVLRLGRLTWFGRNGTPLGALPGDGDYSDFRVSPDGKRLVVSRVDSKVGGSDIWLTDLERGSTSPLTSGPAAAINAAAVWSPDGTRLLFRSIRAGALELYEKTALGGGVEELHWMSGASINSTNLTPTDWSSDGRYVLLSAPTEGSGFNLWLLDLSGDKKAVKFLTSASDLLHANFSPDGRNVAYGSNESGRFEVYVQMFPLSDRKWTISTNGGHEPRWRGDGRELYYLSDNRTLMAVPVGAGPSFGVPKALFQTRVSPDILPLRTHYVPAADGQRFLVNTESGDAAPTTITVVLNWMAGLKH